VDSFSVSKHVKMMALNHFAERVFNLLTVFVGRDEKYDHTMVVNFQGCKLVIRPFLFSEVIMVSGLWEPYVKSILQREIKSNSIIVDVGANIGIYAIPLAKKAQKVIAFEPHPKTSEILVESIKLNNLDNITVEKKIAGDTKRMVKYKMSPVPQESRIISEHESQANSIIQAECMDLDSILMTEDRIDWILLDVEGSELSVLMGAKNMLRKYSPNIIFESYDQNIAKVRQLLENLGYSVRHINFDYYYATK
jgi:FkbM family methyltransferase